MSPTKEHFITCLIFKDHRTSKSFRISLSWFSAFGWTVIVLTGLFLAMVAITTKTLVQERRSSPQALHELETKLSLANESNQQLQKKLEQALNTTHLAIKSGDKNLTSGRESLSGSAPLLFSALTPTLKSVAPKVENELSFRLVKPSVSWKGSDLNFRFFIQYAKEDGKSQHGRLIVLARGPDALLGYPEGVLRLSSSDALIDENQGETFSVGHIREVSADFVAPKSKLVIKEFQALIFDDENNLLWSQVFQNNLELMTSKKTQETPDKEGAGP